MSAGSGAPSTEEESGLLERFGCLIFIIATLLLAAQRYLAFLILGWETAAGNELAFSIMDFMYGDAPYSIFDVLLGFEIPDEGLFFLLQPHNLALGFAQAVHFGLNVAIVAIPFWLLSEVRKMTGARKRLGYLGCFSLVLAPIALVISIWACNSSQGVSSPNAVSEPAGQSLKVELYSNREFGIRFRYPEYLSVQSDTIRDRGPSGEIIEMVSIAATSSDPFVAIVVRVIEDPLRNEMFPNLYPPDLATFQILTVGEMRDLDYDDTPENKSAVLAASERVRQTTIAGHHAGEYQVGLTDTTFGHMYLRGALVITKRRDISLYVVGSDEPGVRGSIDSAYIDGLWEDFVASLEIDF